MNLQTPKTVVRSNSKESCLTGPFNKQHGNRAETLLKPERQHLFHIYWSLRTKFSWKKCFLVTFKMLGLSVNPLTSDDKYSLFEGGNLLQHFQMILSIKEKYFLPLFFAFCKFTFKFELFFKRGDPHSWWIFEPTDSEKRG